MVGFSVIAKIDTVTPGPIKGRNNKFAELFDLINKSPKPAVVVIQYLSPDRFRCCVVGDILSTAFQRIGAVGIVTDVGVSDLTGVGKRAPGFYIFIGNGSFPWIP